MYSRNQAQLEVGKCPTLPLKKVIVEPPLLHTFLHKVNRPIRNEKFGLAWKISGDVWRPSATNNRFKAILHTTLKYSTANEYRELLVLAQSYLLI